MAHFYNEHDRQAAAWLRELIKNGLIADGTVDERDIRDLQPADLVGFTQCHFFAGIGGWSYALRLAGWPDDRPCWTGSCPCQPFSAAGSQTGGDDPRHLWPAWFRLIKECRPDVVFGEQVESAIAHGWLDLVCDDLEGSGYAVGAVGLPACSLGAPHIRQRLWFVADAEDADRRRGERGAETGARPDGERRRRLAGRGVGELADTQGGGQREHGRASGDAGHADECDEVGELADAQQQRTRRNTGTVGRTEPAPTSGESQLGGAAIHVKHSSPTGELADAEDADRRRGERGAETGPRPDGERRRRPAGRGVGELAESEHSGPSRTGSDAQPEGAQQQFGDDGREEGSTVGELADAEHSVWGQNYAHRPNGCDGKDVGRNEAAGEPGARGEVHGMADAQQQRTRRNTGTVGRTEPAPTSGESQLGGAAIHVRHSSPTGELGDTERSRLTDRSDRSADRTRRAPTQEQAEGSSEQPSYTGGWSDLVWLPCRDGKARPTQSGLQPLAHGVPARVGLLRGYGNAIVPHVAAEVIHAYMTKENTHE